jgi:hypothetical protein
MVALITSGGARADDFANRRAAFLNYYDTNIPNVTQTGSGPHRIGRTGFGAAEGRYLAADYVNGSNYMYAALGDADSEATDAGFSMYPAVDCYLRWQYLGTIFTPAINNYFVTQLTTNGTNYSSGATSNQRMMFAATHYLTGWLWGTNLFPAGAQYSADYGTGDSSGLAYVSNTIVNIPLYGFLEHDSLIYVQASLGPIYTLSQFAPDAALRNRAHMVFDWAAAEMAGYYFYDNWAVASDRTEPYWTQNNPSDTTMMTYLFYGGPTPSTYLASYSSALYCMSNFPGILPEVVMAATNRAQSYTRLTSAMRNTGGYNNAYYKTSYITPGYAVYSQAECGVQTNADDSYSITNFGTVSLSDPHQMQRWGVIWNAPGDQTKFWITNPYNPVYSGSAPNIYIGTTISEQVVQLGGTLAAVYNIPTNAMKADWNHNGILMTNYQVLEGQIPTNYSAVIDNSATSGRLFLHYTNVLIGLYISTNFTWVPDANLTNYFLIPANIAGLAIETASPTEYTQSTAALRLAAFCHDVTNNGAANTNFLIGANPEMIYTDRHSNTLSITFGVGAAANGQPIDYQQWPTISDPWVYQSQLGNLFISGTNRTIIYNYNNWTETTNNRPVPLTGTTANGAKNYFTDIDLRARVSDVETSSNNLLFNAGTGSNGTVAILPDGHTARFVAATNYSGAASFTFAATDCGIDPRLVLAYDFQSPVTASATTIPDVSGTARDATVETVGSGAINCSPSLPPALAPFETQSLQLSQSANGVNAVALARTVTTGNLSMTNGSWTFATWLNRAALSSDNFVFYAGSGDGFGGSGDELQLYCPASANTVNLAHWNSANFQDIALASPASVGTNQWHHVALVFQHIAQGTNNVTLYVDGSPVGTASNIVWAIQQNFPLVFGGHASTVSNTSRWFNGSLADLALFRGALSTNDIARLASRTIHHFGGWTITNSVAVNVVVLPNTPPVLTPIANRTLSAGITLTITNTASDTDEPPQTLTFALPKSPTNATVTATNGVLVWRPAVLQANFTNQFSVSVTDSGSPPMSATQNFSVIVNKLNQPALSGPTVTAGHFSLQASGDAGPDYTVQSSTDLLSWVPVFVTNSPVLPFYWADTNTPLLRRNFYRLQLGP